MLDRARVLAEKNGYRMIGLAPSASAVQTLASEAGIESETGCAESGNERAESEGAGHLAPAAINAIVRRNQTLSQELAHATAEAGRGRASLDGVSPVAAN